MVEIQCKSLLKKGSVVLKRTRTALTTIWLLGDGRTGSPSCGSSRALKM